MIPSRALPGAGMVAVKGNARELDTAEYFQCRGHVPLLFPQAIALCTALTVFFVHHCCTGLFPVAQDMARQHRGGGLLMPSIG